MAEYIFTNLPQYVKTNSRTEFSSSVVSSGAALLFSENGSSLTAKLPDGSFVDVGGGSGGTDVSSTTAEAGDVLAGKVFYTSGGVQTSGTIPTVSAGISGSQVIVPSGYIPASQSFNISSGGVDVSDTTATPATVLGGYDFYDSTGTKTSGTIPTVSSATITPTTSNQIISSGVYLGGEQTIAGDSNLVGSNIVSGVTIFGVTGTASGGGSTNFYKCATVTAPGILVSGAGDERVNGLYTDTGEVMNGEPIYSLTKDGYTSYYYRTSDASWRYVISPEIYNGNRNAGPDTAQYIKSDYSNTWESVYYGTSPAPTVTEVNPENPIWTGYKAIQDPQTGTWSFEQTATSGLVYTGFIPEVGKVYDEHATIQANLYTGV